MQHALVAAMIAIALVTWLPDAAKAMRKSMFTISEELNAAAGDPSLTLAESGR